MDKQALLALLMKHEGFRATCYRDSRGFLTVGYGCNLDAKGALADCESVGANYQDLRSGKPISNVQAQGLLDIGAERAANYGLVLVRSFDDLPPSVQLAVTDMIYNLGPSKFSEFANLIASLEKKDWAGAASAMVASEWYGQVGDRAKDDINLVLHAEG